MLNIYFGSRSAREKNILNDFFHSLSYRKAFLIFKMHNNCCSFVFFYCTDCFSGDRWCRIDFFFVSCNHGKSLPFLPRLPCLSGVVWIQTTLPEKPERKIVKTFSVRQKLCSRIVVRYQTICGFFMLPFFGVIFSSHVLLLLFCHCEHFLYRRRENIRKQTKKRHRRAKLHFQYCLVSAGFSFTVICLLEICNFWNYYFICIVWSHRHAVSRHCHRHNISNLTDHFH